MFTSCSLLDAYKRNDIYKIFLENIFDFIIYPIFNIKINIPITNNQFGSEFFSRIKQANIVIIKEINKHTYFDFACLPPIKLRTELKRYKNNNMGINFPV